MSTKPSRGRRQFRDVLRAKESSPQTAAGSDHFRQRFMMRLGHRWGATNLRALYRQIPRLVSVVLVGSDQPTLLRG